jgi:acyl-ACP thioesterase
MYEEKWKVRFSECDSEHTLSYQGIVNYFQDCSNLQSEEYGVGMESLAEENMAWILDFWQIVIEKRPQAFDNIAVSTWAHAFKGFFGMRNFLMKAENGENLAYANSYWVYYDRNACRPARVPDELAAAYKVEPPFAMEYAKRKIAVPENIEYVDEFKVQKHHLDIYNHMNNARYIEAACDYLPQEPEVAQICCQYCKQARLGETVRVFRTMLDKNVYIILKDTDDSIFAAIKFDLK